jgi:insulysin
LTLIWELPSQFAHMKDTKPDIIVCHVLGHEGKNSLLDELKKENLAEDLNCGTVRLGADKLMFFLEIGLTEDGLKNVDTVIERCFETIANFKQKGIPQYLFDEIHRMATIRYQYQEREDVFYKIMKQANWLADEDISTFPEQTLIIQKFDPEAVAKLLTYLTPQNSRIEIMAPDTATGVKHDQKEPWLNVPYAVKPIPENKLKAWAKAKPHPNIDLPQPNPLIPTHLKLVNPDIPKPTTQIPRPKAIIDNEMSKIYFAADARYRVPKISWHIQIKTPQVDAGDPTKLVLADLYIKSVTDALSNYGYYAKLADLDYDISRDDFGIKITIDGYSENAALLFDEVIRELKSSSPSEQMFNIYKDSLQRDYENAAKEMPFLQASEMLKGILYKSFTSSKEKVVAIRKISFEQYQDYAKTLFNQSYVEGMFYGNLTENDAKGVADKLQKALGSALFPKKDRKKVEVIIIPDKQGPFFVDSKIKSQGNAAILAIEDPNFSFQTRAAQQVMMLAIEQSFFDTLRTKQQTGYLVYSADEEIARKLFNFFGVQSNTHDPRDLLARFELFIESYLQEINTQIPQERFDIFKLALLTTLKQPPKNPKEMGELLNRLAFKYDGDFDWLDKRIDALEKLDYLTFIDITRSFLGKKNKRRLAVLLKGITPEEKTLDYFRLKQSSELKKVSQYLPSS